MPADRAEQERVAPRAPVHAPLPSRSGRGRGDHDQLRLQVAVQLDDPADRARGPVEEDLALACGRSRPGPTRPRPPALRATAAASIRRHGSTFPSSDVLVDRQALAARRPRPSPSRSRSGASAPAPSRPPRPPRSRSASRPAPAACGSAPRSRSSSGVQVAVQREAVQLRAARRAGRAMPLAMGTLVAAHNTDRQHPMGSHQPSNRHGVGRRGRGGLVTVKEHRGVLLGVCPRPAPPGAGARCRNAPLRASRDMSRSVRVLSDTSQVSHPRRTERVRKLRVYETPRCVLGSRTIATRSKLYNVSLGGLTVEAVALPLFPALEAPRTTDAGAVGD